MGSEGEWTYLATLAVGNDLDRIACVILATGIVDDVLSNGRGDRRVISRKIRERLATNGGTVPYGIKKEATRAVRVRNQLVHDRILPSPARAGNAVRGLIRYLEVVVPDYPRSVWDGADQKLNGGLLGAVDVLELEAGLIRCSDANYSTLHGLVDANDWGTSNHLRIGAVVVACTLFEHALGETVRDADYRRLNLSDRLADDRTWQHLPRAMAGSLQQALELRRDCAHWDTEVAREDATDVIVALRGAFRRLEGKHAHVSHRPKSSSSATHQPPPPVPPEFRVEVIRPIRLPEGPSPTAETPEVPEGGAENKSGRASQESARRKTPDSSDPREGGGEPGSSGSDHADSDGLWKHVLSFVAGVLFGVAAEQQANKRRVSADSVTGESGKVPPGASQPSATKVEVTVPPAVRREGGGRSAILLGVLVISILMAATFLVVSGTIGSFSRVRNQTTNDADASPRGTSTMAWADPASDLRIYERDDSATTCGYVAQLGSYGRGEISHEAWRVDAETWKAVLSRTRPATSGVVVRFHKMGDPVVGLVFKTSTERDGFMSDHANGLIVNQIRRVPTLPGRRDPTWNARVCFRAR